VRGLKKWTPIGANGKGEQENDFLRDTSNFASLVENERVEK
jgi:hypothetical protein